MTDINQSLQSLVGTISALRGENGCPWDKKQTPHSLVKHLKAEVEELIQAIFNNDTQNICEEIGDVLYVLIMISKCHSDEAAVDFKKAILNINEKLIRRHPHVFAGATYKDEEELKQQWQKIKEEEKRNNSI